MARTTQFPMLVGALGQKALGTEAAREGVCGVRWEPNFIGGSSPYGAV